MARNRSRVEMKIISVLQYSNKYPPINAAAQAISLLKANPCHSIGELIYDMTVRTNDIRRTAISQMARFARKKNVIVRISWTQSRMYKNNPLNSNPKAVTMGCATVMMISSGRG